MLRIIILLIIVVIYQTKATYPDNGETTIRFKIYFEQLNGMPTLTCDHSDDMKLQNKYTVREGELFKIIAEYDHIINHFMCNDYFDEDIVFDFRFITMKNVTVNVDKIMGTLWKCTILSHQNLKIIHPVVPYKSDTYAAAYCFMKIHVRRTEAPQTVLVNNMVLPAVRTNLSEKLVDFTAEYQYADGDLVAVTCANFLKEKPILTMEYEIAGTMSDNSTMKDLSSNKAIGLDTKMNSAHNNSYMICTATGTTDYTKVILRFVMRTEFHIVSIKINGMNLRPNLYDAKNNYYRIEYKYLRYQPINVVCEVERRADVKLMVIDDQFINRKDLILNKKTFMSFFLDPNMKKKLACSADYRNGRSAEQVAIYFTDGNFPIDPLPLDMESRSHGTVMKLYRDYQLKVIYYEFEDGETLNLNCSRLPLYLKQDSKTCMTNWCTVSKTMRVTFKGENTEKVCYLNEEGNSEDPSEINIVHTELRVILRERILTTTITTNNPATTSATLTSEIITINTTAAPAPSEASTHSSSNANQNILIYYLVPGAIAVFIIIVVAVYFIVKKRCCVRSNPSILVPRPHPDTVFYENLLAVFRPINEREAAEMEMQNIYEEIQ